MEKFSGGYIPVNLNFVASDVLVFEDITDQYKGVCAALRNILFRGAPTKPSQRIRGFLGNPEKYGNITCFNKPDDYKWANTIKGYYSNNPAAIFYERLKKELPDYWYYFLPECPFKNISNDPNWPDSSSVDFYDPIHKIVIEIDGSQHGETVNKTNDLRRDEELKRMGLKKPIRIPTNSSEEQLIDAFKTIKKEIREANYGLLFSKSKLKTKLDSLEAEYLVSFRIEVALLLFLEKGFFNSDPSIEILNSNGVTNRTVEAAIRDFKDLHDNLCVLAGIDKRLDITKTSIVNEFIDDEAIKIDIGCDVLYDEEIFQRHTRKILIRNDYFFYALKGVHTGVEHYPRHKNYYKVACGTIDYSGLKDNHSKYVSTLEYFLEQLFGHSNFRPKQAEIIINGLQRSQGVVGLLPTGSGKSVCFQLVSFLTPGLTIVVSPLTLLMQDQCDNLFSRNLISTAYFINLTETGKNSLDYFENVQSKITYIAPERFFNDKFVKIITKLSLKITQVVLDEVHCLSEWGHDFRTSYLLLFSFLKKVGVSDHSLLMGTSATSSPRVTYDITREFSKLKTSVVVVRSSSVKRPELFFRVIKYSGDEDRNNKIIDIVRNNVDQKKKTLIFVPYRKDTDEVKSLFSSDPTIRPDTCIGPDSGEKKKKLLTDFASGETNTMVATKAFGMGLDIPDIRETIHSDFSSSVESAYQEMGRAGRDGNDSVCTILFEEDDWINRNTEELFASRPKPSEIKHFSDGVDYGALTKQLKLISLSNEDPDKESSFVFAVSKYLSQGKTTFKLSEAFESMKTYGVINRRFYKNEKDKNGNWKFTKDLGSFENFFEKALYKLYLLKIVPLWSKNYDNSLDDPIFFGLKYRAIESEEKITKNLHAYINQYEVSYKKKANNLEEAIFLLCNWTFENFYQHRWSSLRTLYEMIRDFDDSESLASRIENYFSQNEVLERSIANPLEHSLWFDAIQSDGPEILKDQLARFIEDYPNQIAVNFITGFVYLILDNFEDINGRNRLSLAFSEMGYFSRERLEEILEHISKMPLSDGQKKTLLCFFADERPDCILSPHIQKTISQLPRRECDEFETYYGLKTTIRKMDEMIKEVEKLL